MVHTQEERLDGSSNTSENHSTSGGSGILFVPAARFVKSLIGKSNFYNNYWQKCVVTVALKKVLFFGTYSVK